MPCICSGPRDKRLPYWQIVFNPVDDVAGKTQLECSICERTWRSSAAYVDTITKGTQKRDARALLDAFDAIGAARGGGTGVETTTFSCTALPEHFEQIVALHAEFLREPTFPQDRLDVCLELTRQEQTALQDDPQELVDKYLSEQAYGSVLGRHELGSPATIASITRDDVVAHWQRHFHAGRMQVSVAGAVEPQQVEQILEKHFSGFGSSDVEGRSHYPLDFCAKTTHHSKKLEQQHIGFCFPGVSVTHDDFPTQTVTLGILSGGMSSRLFTEVREKQGLVYWVGAWNETPRGSGIMFLGASTTPQRCDETYEALLREVERLSEDLTQEELDRAVTGLVTGRETRGDTTRARCAELANKLFCLCRPVPVEKKVADLQAVTLDDIDRYLSQHPRDRLCTMTLGPRHLNAQPSTTTQSVPSGPQAEAIDR